MNDDIKFYLTYGYFPDYNLSKYVPDIITKLDINDLSYKQKQEKFIKIFKEVIAKNINEIPTHKKIIIPISGGLDSRSILAEVIKNVDINRITTYTFGIKGSYDYEIGKEVAKKAGVKHIAINLNTTLFTQNDMVEVAKLCDFQTHLFHHPPLSVLKEIAGEGIIISGYLGDIIFGSYAHFKNVNFQSANEYYLKHKYYSDFFAENYLENNRKLLNFEFDEDSPVLPLEQLILYERGPKLTAPHILLKGWEYKVPLIDKKIMDFMFSLPQNERINERFFIDAMIRFYPDLFNIRAKTTYGFHLKSNPLFHYYARLKNKIIWYLNIYGANFVYTPFNYLDYNKAILYRDDINKIVVNNLHDLKNRNLLDFDPFKIYQQHKKSKNLYTIILLLTSLEIILKAKEL